MAWTPRFNKYLLAAGGSKQLALDLYEWNASLGQSLMREIAHFEIALRNSYDATFTKLWSGLDHWLLDPESPVVTPIWRVKKDRTGLKRGSDVNFTNRRLVDSVIRGCGGIHASPGKVIAELSFGFWRQLTTSPREKTIWVPYLHHAFPSKTNRSEIDTIIFNINAVRNRIAHHEPIFDRRNVVGQEPQQLQEDLLYVFSLIAPEVGSHIRATSDLISVLNRRPIK